MLLLYWNSKSEMILQSGVMDTTSWWTQQTEEGNMNPPNHKSQVITNQLNAAEYFTENIQNTFIHSFISSALTVAHTATASLWRLL